MKSVEEIAAELRESMAGWPRGSAVEYVYAVGRIRALVADEHMSTSGKLAAIRDTLAALDLVHGRDGAL